MLLVRPSDVKIEAALHAQFGLLQRRTGELTAMADFHTRILVIGAGPAGYTAAIYAARANLRPIVLQGSQPGGQLTITSEVENYPGFAKAVQGPWLMDEMAGQASQVGAILKSDTVTQVDFDRRPFRALTESGDVYWGDAVIIATGAQARWLGLESETLLRGAGVSACATCDGFFFRGKEVAVVGGGNSAVEEALYLTNHATRVTVVHRGEKFRAERILQDRLFGHPKIAVMRNSVVDEIVGEAGNGGLNAVNGVRIRNTTTGDLQWLAVQGVFVAIGHDPATSLFRGMLDLDDRGYIRIGPWSTLTSREGVYAAGDVADPQFRQAVTAAGMGCMAALEAERWLAGHATSSEYSAI
jgi:thioredoxin reductase (NADPH)